MQAFWKVGNYMYRTAPKKTEETALMIFVLFTVCMLVVVPPLIVDLLDDDFSKYSILDAVVTVFLSIVSTYCIVYNYCMLVRSVVCFGALCSITSSGVRVHYRWNIKKDFLLSWENIERVVISTPTQDSGSTPQIVCFSAERAKEKARMLSIESKPWKCWSFFIMRKKGVVTIMYSSEAFEEIKKYHPDIEYYPNKKVIEGYIEDLNKESI